MASHHSLDEDRTRDTVLEFLKDMPSFHKDNFSLHSDLSARSSRRPSIYLPTEEIPSEVGSYHHVQLEANRIPYSLAANHYHREEAHPAAVPAPAVEQKEQLEEKGERDIGGLASQEDASGG